jgi:DNA-binding NarL/FixJ family response regulator
MTEAQPVRVVLVDDHSMVRSGVRAELATDSGVETVGEAGSVGEAVAVIGRTKPEVVLLDVHARRRRQGRAGTGPGSGRTVAGPVGERRRRGRDRGDPGQRPRLRNQDDLRPGLGGRGAPGRGRRRGVLVPAGRFRAGGVQPAGVVRQLDPELDQLTQREREGLRLLARGYAYKEIASRLFISVKTVETHVSSVLRKLQLSNRYELSRCATDRRLV